MRAPDGRLKILDFGLAIMESAAVRAVAGSPITQPGAIMGTPAYMAPEQLNGGKVDARTDVFALGVLLYEYATGTHPFEAPTPLARVARLLETDPAPIQGLRPDLPPQLVSVITRSLRKTPEERFASAAELAVALSRDADQLSRDPDREPGTGTTRWWRTHQTAMLGLYFLACGVAWQIKEWQHGPADTLFLFIGVAATIVGVLRGHLLFTEQMNRASFPAERRRVEPITFAVDVMIALALSIDGLLLRGPRPLAAVLTIALGVGIALARLVVEPSTIRGAFPEAPGGHPSSPVHRS
jgi:hypothetical protein